jgi:hypothetical protein
LKNEVGEIEWYKKQKITGHYFLNILREIRGEVTAMKKKCSITEQS